MLARLVEVSPGGSPDTAVALTFQRNGENRYDAAFLTVDEAMETARDMLRSLSHDDRERVLKALTQDFEEYVAERFCASLRPPPPT